MRRLWRRARSLGAYVAIPLLSGLAPFLLLPAVTSQYGAEGWALFAVAQALGMAFAVGAEAGWGVVGPQRVAAADEPGRRHLFAVSLRSKALALMVVAPLAAVAGFLLGDVGQRSSSSAIAAACSLSALQQGWFFYGGNQPRSAFLTDAVPKIVASVAGAAAMAVGLPLGILAIVFALQALVSVLIAVRLVRPPRLGMRNGAREALRALRQQRVLLGGRLITVGYTYLPVVLVRLISPSAVAEYAALDRIMRMGLSVLTAAPNRLQSWIGSAQGAERSRRCRVSLLLNLVLGIGSAMVYVVGVYLAAPFLFSGTVTLNLASVVTFAGIVVVICTSRGAGLWLVGIGRANQIATAAVTAAVVGVPAVAGLTAWLGTPFAAAIGVLLAEVSALAIQLAILRGRRRSRRLTGPARADRVERPPARQPSPGITRTGAP